MNAHKFVASKGAEEAKRVLESSNDAWAYDAEQDCFFDGSDLQDGYSIEHCNGCFLVEELKQVVESIEIVEQLGELNAVKKKLCGKHIGYTHFNVGANGRWAFLDHYVDFIPDSAYHIGLINKHIANYELVESYKENQHV